MKNDKLWVSVMVSLITFCVFGSIIGSIQLYYWDLWDEGINVKADAKREKCLNIMNQNLDNEKDFINYERTNADTNTFMISSECYQYINNYDYMVKKAFKNSYFNRMAIWVLNLLMSLTIAVSTIYDSNKYEDIYNDNYY